MLNSVNYYCMIQTKCPNSYMQSAITFLNIFSFLYMFLLLITFRCQRKLHSMQKTNANIMGQQYKLQDTQTQQRMHKNTTSEGDLIINRRNKPQNDIWRAGPFIDLQSAHPDNLCGTRVPKTKTQQPSPSFSSVICYHFIQTQLEQCMLQAFVRMPHNKKCPLKILSPR